MRVRLLQDQSSRLRQGRMLVCAALLALPVAAHAQSGEWSEGQWSVAVPAQGSCASLPLLQVKGSAALFDGGNAASLQRLEQTISNGMAAVCPGTKEAVLVAGRARKLVTLPPPSGAAGAPPPVATASAVAPASVPAPASRSSSTPATPSPQRPSTPEVSAAAAPPQVDGPVSLKSFVHARSESDKCEALLSWLQTTEQSLPPSRNNYALPAGMMAAFADPQMTAVFGAPYDRLENATRIDMWEKEIGPCTGARPMPRQQPQRPVVVVPGISIGRSLPGLGRSAPGAASQPVPPELIRQVGRYRDLVNGAFGGGQGLYNPIAVNKFVADRRVQVEWARGEMQAAAQGSATDAIERIEKARSSVPKQMTMLSKADQEAVTHYLEAREGQLGLPVFRAYLAQAETMPHTLESATALKDTRLRLNGAYARLSESERKVVDDAYWRIADADIHDAVAAEVAKLNSFPATLQGAHQLATWETATLKTFEPFRRTPSMGDAAEKFAAARTRVYGGALPAWTKEVNSSPLEIPDVKRTGEQLAQLFPDASDRSGEPYATWSGVVAKRTEQLQAKLEADARKKEQDEAAERKRIQELQMKQLEANAAYRSQMAAPGAASAANTGAVSANGCNGCGTARTAPSAGKLTPYSLVTLEMKAAPTFQAIYVGDFAHVPVDRGTLAFGAITTEYMDDFYGECRNFLPATAVPIMVGDCDAWVSSQYGWGPVTTSCTHPFERPTGKFADPMLYAASEQLKTKQALNAASDMMSGFFALFSGKGSGANSNGNPFTGMLDSAGKTMDAGNQLKHDVRVLIQNNGCGNPALDRFQENLRRYADNDPPIILK